MKRVLLALACVAAAVPASAEIVTLKTGRTMSVKSYHQDGDRVTLTLRQGGTIECDASTIVGVSPDEVPYPEPEIQTAAPLPSTPFAEIIETAATRHGISAELVRAIIQVESNYAPRARSPKGAMGLMQLMPATARQYAVADAYDPEANIDAGIRHFKLMLARFGQLPLALAAYNAGEGAVRRFGGIPPFAETRSYVRRIIALARPTL